MNEQIRGGCWSPRTNQGGRQRLRKKRKKEEEKKKERKERKKERRKDKMDAWLCLLLLISLSDQQVGDANIFFWKYKHYT